MNLLRFRTLNAPANPMHAAYTAATGRTIQDAVGETGTAATNWIPTDAGAQQNVFAILAVLANNPGVLDATNPDVAALVTDRH